jgi:hypothetical protein
MSFAPSLKQVGLDFLIRNALELFLTKMNVNSEIKQSIETWMGTTLALASNPLSLLQLGFNGCAASAGQRRAWQLIRVLPKLRKEPDANPDVHNGIIEKKDEASNVMRRKKLG